MTMTAEKDVGDASASLRPAAAEVMAGVAAAVDGLLAADFTLPGTADILDLLRDIEIQARRLHTASVRVTAQIVDRGLAAPAGASSTAALLRQVLPLSAADAHQRVRLAAATSTTIGLTGAPIPPVLPLLAAALSAGSVGAAQAATIVTTMTGLPLDVPSELLDSVEEFLVEQAAVLDPKTLHNVARRIALMANPDGPYDERDAAEKQEFHIGARRDDGLTRCWGLLDDLTVEALRTALGALCAPAADRNRPTPGPDTGTGTATAETATQTTGHVEEPGDAEPEDAKLTGDYDTESADQPAASNRAAECDQPAPREPWRASRPPFDWAPLGTLPGDYPPPDQVTTGLPPGQRSPEPPPPIEDRRSAGTRRAHALSAILTAFLSSGAAPTIHGEKPHLLVTISEADLRQGIGHAQLGYGDTIPIAHARMIACDAAVIPAVLRGASDIIDIGRAMRTFTAAGRKAILLRDIGCVFPGCTMPGAWCDNHHIQHWADGGPSNLDNAALLCRRHHTFIHHGLWQIRLGADRTPEIIPPTTHDPAQQPLRNTLHRPPAFTWPA